MPPPARAFTCGVVLAAGGSRRLGQPKQLLPYDDGRGHPLAFGRRAFGALAGLHGDKAVWKLLERSPGAVAEVRVPGPVPLDVDTWEDYEAVLA